MPTPETLYATITLRTIDEYVTTHREEDLHLDFKTAKPSMTRDDRRTSRSPRADSRTATAASSSGASTHQERKEQRAKPHCSRSARSLRNSKASPVAANPIVDGIQHRGIEEQPDAGYAITLIPASDRGPHMAKLGEDRYYKRTGDRFAVIEHFDITDMFGRRARPALTTQTVLRNGSISRGGGNPTRRTIHIIIQLRNDGRARASAPYLSLEANPPYVVARHGLSTVEGPLRPTAQPSHTAQFTADATVVIHPTTTYEAAQIVATFEDNTAFPDLIITTSVAALDLPVQTSKDTIKGTTIRDHLNK